MIRPSTTTRGVDGERASRQVKAVEASSGQFAPAHARGSFEHPEREEAVRTASGAAKGGEFPSSVFSSLIKELQCLVEVPFGDFLHGLAIREVAIEQAQRSGCR